MNFLREDELLEYVLGGIVSVGGDIAHKTIQKLLQEFKGSHQLLALEEAVSYAFDKAGHVLMSHIGKKIAKEKCHDLTPLPIQTQESTLSIRLSACPVYELSDKLKPTEALVCSLCRGCMENIGDSLKVGSLRYVRFSEGACEFVYGGETNGYSRLHS